MRSASLVVLVVVLAPAAALAGLFSIAGSGVEKKEARDVPAFEEIDLGGQAKVVVEVGAAAQTVEVSGDDNLVALVETKVKGKTLKIGWTAKRGADPKLPPVVKIGVPKLVAVEVSGAGSLEATGVVGPAFQADVSGAGRVVLVGATDALKASVSGAGNVDAAKLVAKRVEASVSGAGDVLVAPVDELKAGVSGAGSVRYVGAPAKLEKNVSGVGAVLAAK